MLLTEIRDYLQLRGRVSLSQLAYHFDMPESAIEAMLEIWVKKGKVGVSQSDAPSCGSSCGGCSNACNTVKSYTWLGKK